MNNEKGETLTDAMLAALPAHLQPVREGKYLRAGCPFHASDKQRSLSINTETGRFQCFGCSIWGYTERSRDQWKQQHQGDAGRPYRAPAPWAKETGTDRLRADGDEPVPVEAATLEQLQTWQAELPEATEYLAARRIPMELVQQLGGGVGYFGNARRLVLPHTDPVGRIVSLYGRRIDGGDTHKHHHLPGRPKGFLNAPAANADELWLTEGPFDALALMAAGIPNAAAVFGVQGIRWGWLGNVRRLVLALDVDDAGRKAIEEHAKQAAMRGMEVLAVMPDELGGAKDIAEAWVAGTLRLTDMAPVLARRAADPAADHSTRVAGLLNALPDSPPAGLSASQWMDYRATARRFLQEYSQQAQALGWTDLELFGLPDPARPWEGGAIWAMASYELRGITQDELQGITDRGGPMTARRDSLRPARLPW